MLDRKYLKRVAIYIAGSVLAIGLACYFAYHLWLGFNREIETIPAVTETYSVTAEYDAWVFRDEAVITSSATGSDVIVPSVRNGERVSKTQPVASSYSSVSPSALSELETVRSQLRLIKGKHTSALSGDLGIGELMLSLSASYKNGDLSSASDISSRLTALAAVRASGGGDTASVVASLTAKEQELIASFGTSSGKIFTPYSGWYYSTADGYESVFTPDAAVGISPDGLDALLGTAPVPVDSAAGRVVRTYRWYIAVNMNSADSSAFIEGDTTEITLAGITEPITLSVESAVNGSDNRTAVVFSCGTLPEGYDIGRRLTVEFTLKEISGFGVPKEAVRIQDGVTGVYTYNGVMVKFRKVRIAAEQDDLYIVTTEDNAPVTEPPATTAPDTSSDGTSGDSMDKGGVSSEYAVGSGTGRKEYDWLEAHEFIIVKGKALHNGKIIG